MKRWLLASLGIVLLIWLVASCVLFVDQAEHVYVTQFGRQVATYDGATDAGLHLKAPWPIQTVLRLDRRLQIFDVPTQELLIRDQDEKTGEARSLPLTFDLYVCWRIADQRDWANWANWASGASGANGDPVDQFVRRFGTLERAQEVLRSWIISRLKIELGDVPLAGLANTDPAKLRVHEMLDRLRTRPYVQGAGAGEQPLSLTERARRDGIELIDIQLRRFNHPVQVREEIFAKIREVRKREANNYRLQGEEQANQIRVEGEREARRIRTEADAHKIRREGEARAEAIRILNDAHKEAPELYRLVRLLEGYKKMFADDRTQLILSLDHPLLTLFKDLPKMNGTPTPATGIKPPAGKPMPPGGNGPGQ